MWFNISNIYILRIIMLKKLLDTYYKLLDEKLENWTIVVILIAILIVSVSLIINNTNAKLYAKNNILEINRNTTHSNIYKWSFLELNWIKYKISLQEVSK